MNSEELGVKISLVVTVIWIRALCTSSSYFSVELCSVKYNTSTTRKLHDVNIVNCLLMLQEQKHHIQITADG